MLNEILNSVFEIKNLGVILDLTFGRGGHSLAIKKRNTLLKIIAIDQDENAVKWGEEVRKNQGINDFFIYHLNFHNLEEHQKSIFEKSQVSDGVDAILLDLGVSSPQLDNPERGFSFYEEGPLDMRMDHKNDESIQARDILNEWSEEKLTWLFKDYGEIRNPRFVVHSIIRQRKKKLLETTEDFSKLILKTVPWKKRGKHPATSYFLALRMLVNNELEGLQSSLPMMLEALNEGGRIFVLTFHSLEASIVKNFFKQCKKENRGVLVNKKVIKPSREETLKNRRSRSSQLRIFEKRRIIKSI